MDLRSVRVLDIGESFAILLISLVVLAVLLRKYLDANNRRYIPLLLSLYGCAFCLCIIYVFGEGFTGIAFVLLSWAFIAIAIISLIVICMNRKMKR